MLYIDAMLRFLTNLSLGKKITLLTALGLLLGVGVFSSLGMRAVNQATETTLQDRLTTAGLVADYVNEALERALVELSEVAHTIVIDQPENNLDAQIEELEKIYSRLSIHTHGFYLVSEAGEIVWCKPDESTMIGLDFPLFSEINQDQNDSETGISMLASEPLTNAPVVFLTSATKAGSQGEKGILAVAIDIGQSGIGGFIKPIRLGQTGYVEIVDQNGIVLARTEPGPTLAPFEQSDHSGHFAALIADGKPTRGVCHTCHESEQKVQRKDVLAFVPLTEANWGVVVRQSEQEALAPTRELRLNLLLFGVGLVSVALLFVVITTRDVGGRIRMLTTVSRRIAEGDLTSPVATLGKDEVGILSQSLDDMRLKLKTSYGELEQKTGELTSLLSVSDILTSTLDLPGLLDAVLAKAVDIISGAEGGALLVLNPDRSDPDMVSTIGLDKETLSKLWLTASKPSEETTSESLYNARGFSARDTVAAFLQSDDLHPGTQSSIYAEISHRSQSIGIIVMVNFQKTEAFSESDRRLLSAIADYIAIAVERSQLAKEAEEARALHEADRLRSQFISSVSHELRTPLTLIKGYCTSLLRQDVSWDLESQWEFLQIIDEKTDELRDLIDKILQSAKLEAGALKLEKEPLLIPRLARKIIEEIAPRAKNHKFTLRFAPAFPVLEADVRCMEQVLRNLAENAVKYSPAGGEIIIAGEVDSSKVVVSVSDNGMGIPAEHREKVFYRFYRVSNLSTRSNPGSGLGLSITKGHVEAHGGEVWLESKVGVGSTFYFSLPLDQTQDSE